MTDTGDNSDPRIKALEDDVKALTERVRILEERERNTRDGAARESGERLDKLATHPWTGVQD